MLDLKLIKLNQTSVKQGFTLSELLLALSLLVILFALSFPVVQRLRENAKQLKCVSHLGKVGFALNSYANDHGNCFPANYGPTRTPPDRMTWMAKAAPYVGMQESEIGNDPVPRSAGIFVCPSYTEEERLAREVSYRYNHPVIAVWELKRAIMPLSKLFLVVETTGVNTEFFRVTVEGDVARRHPQKSANFLYADGHVESISAVVPASDPCWGLTRN